MKNAFYWRYGWAVGWLAWAGWAWAAADLIDTGTPEMQELKKAYGEERAELARSRLEGLKNLLTKSKGEAEDMLAMRRTAGNIAGMAAARGAIEMFEKCQEQLDKEKNFKLPSKFRREVAEMMENGERQKRAIEDEHVKAMDALRKKFQIQFLARGRAQIAALPGPEKLQAELEEKKKTQEVELTKAKNELDAKHAQAVRELTARYATLIAERTAMKGEESLRDESLTKVFEDFAGKEEAPVAEPAEVAAGHGTPAAGEAAGEAAEPLPVLPEILASSGEAVEWVAVGRWFAEMNGMDVLEVPIANRTKPLKKNDTSMMSGNSHLTQYEPVRDLSPAPGYAYRLKSMQGREGADVLEWPSAGNGWKLTLRLRPAAKTLPARHGIEIQVGFPGASVLPLVGKEAPAETARAGGAAGAAPAPEEPKVKVGIRTTPAEAYVFVDGRVYRTEQGVPKTPCVILVPQGERDIVLKKAGYVDGNFLKFDAREGKIIQWKFEKDPAFVEKTVRVMAKSAWRSSGVEVAKGDRISIEVAGTWSCGSKKEMVDADGYPNNAQYYHYYLNPATSPRQAAGNYGALLMRIGATGSVRVVGKAGNFVADADGPLLFDINEATGDHRNNNMGMLSVVIRKSPAPR